MPGIEAVGSLSKRTASLANDAPTKHFDVAKFVGNFELLATATGGIECLRAMTLYLAIRGALTGEIRSGDPATNTDGLIPPFNLPAGWAWRQVKEVGDIKLGRQRAPNNHTGPHMRPYLRVANVHEARIDISDVMEMNFEPEEAQRFLLAPGDVLLNEGQSYELVGRPAIYRGEVPGACFQNTLIRFRPMEGIVLCEYALVVFRAYMRTGRFRQEAQQTTNIAHLSAGRLAVIEFPLPPLAEQKRIVARVDQLMALIDDLEAKQTKKRDLSTRFTKSSLEALTTAESPEAFDAAWQRVVENFSTTIDRAEKVEQFRSVILAVAVQGKLLPAEPDSEPAIILADRIRARRGLASNTRIDAVSPPFELPSGWCWSSLPELGELGRGKSKHRPRNDPALFRDGKYPMIQTGDVARANGVVATHTALYGEKGLAQSRLWPKGTLCITIAANIADSALLGFDACFPDSVVGFVPDAEIGDARYFEFFLRTAKQRIEDFAPATAQKNVNLEILSKVLVPLPPKAEMRRIVAKVDQLMKLCDDLEAKLRHAEDRASKLVEAVVQEMVA